MTKATLEAQIIDTAHRPDLASRVGEFVKLAEEMIARDVRATEQVEVFTLTDADRIAPDSNVYAVPSNYLWDRAVYAPTPNGGSCALSKKSLAEIRRLPLNASPQWFTVHRQTIEIRGAPGTGVEIDLEYFARLPPLVAPGDSNELLVAHEELYLSGALFFLHRYTQDNDLAQGYLDSFAHAARSLNEQAATKLGGQSVAPAYNFSPSSAY